MSAPVFFPPSPTENYDARVYYQKILGGTNNTEPIKLDDVFALCEEFIYTIQNRQNRIGSNQPQFWRGKLGPYVSGHRRNTPQNPSGSTQAELVGTQFPMMYGGPQSNVVDRSVRNVQPYENSPTETKRGFLYKNGENIVSASGIVGAIRLIFTYQTLISWTIHKLTVYGEGGNTGYFNPSTYSSTRSFSFAYNFPHRTRWVDSSFPLNASTPYGNPLEDPEARPPTPNNALAWSVDLVYGTSLASSRQSVNDGNQPVPTSVADAQSPPSTRLYTIGSMAAKFYGYAFPPLINTTNPPAYYASSASFGPITYPPAVIDPTNSRRDGRVTQPRIGKMASDRDLPLREGDVIFRSSIMSAIATMAEEWHIADRYSTTMFERIVCHASCHSSCHGSRGRR